MKRFSLLLTILLSLSLGLSYNTFAQKLDNTPLSICNVPPGCQEVPVCTYTADCFRFDFFTPKDLGNGTSAIKIKITNYSESTFKQATFELPGMGASTPPAISPNTSFSNRYNHSVVNKYNDSLIAFNAINAGTFSYGGFEVYYYVVANSDLNAAYGRTIQVTAHAGRPWQLQRFGSVIIDIDDCIPVGPCTPPTAIITGPDTVCLFNDDPYIFSTPIQAGATYSWSITNASIIDGNGTNTVQVVPDVDLGPGLITVIVTNDCGSDTASKPFEVIECQPINPLPVSLTSFDGKRSPEGIILDWKTASEKNNDRFEIYRSSNGKGFEKVGTVKGNGNSSSTLAYQFADKNPLQGVNYYRLKQIDFDGKYEYSRIIQVNNADKLKAFTVNLAPNPCTDGKCNIQLKGMNNNLPVTVEIRDLTGRIVYTQVVPADQSTFELPKLENGAGIYILSARNGEQTAIQKVILK